MKQQCIYKILMPILPALEKWAQFLKFKIRKNITWQQKENRPQTRRRI